MCTYYVVPSLHSLTFALFIMQRPGDFTDTRDAKNLYYEKNDIEGIIYIYAFYIYVYVGEDPYVSHYPFECKF